MEENQTNQEEQSGQTQEEEQSYVPVTEATDEELDAFLAGELEGEVEDEEAAQTETQQEDATEDTDEDGEDQTAATEQEDGEETESDKKALSEHYVKKLEERLEQQESYIKKRSNEIGELRAELRKANEKFKELLTSEDFISDPSAAVDAKIQMRENEQKLKGLDAEEIAMSQVINNQRIVHSHVETKEWDLQAMVNCLEEDGIPPETIKSFAENPYATTDGVTLIQLHKRQRAENAFRQLAVYTKKLAEENKTLKEKPHKVLKDVERKMKKPASVTADNGGSGSTRGLSIDESQIASLSDAELDAFLASPPSE